jgi:hypothetical protein
VIGGYDLTAITDRYFADGGHALDFLEKAFEAIDPSV